MTESPRWAPVVAATRGPGSARRAAACRWPRRRRSRGRGRHHRLPRDRGRGDASHGVTGRAVPGSLSHHPSTGAPHTFGFASSPPAGRRWTFPSSVALGTARAMAMRSPSSRRCAGPAARLPWRSCLRPGGHRGPRPGAPRRSRGGRRLCRTACRHPDHRRGLRRTLVDLLLLLDGHGSRGDHGPRHRAHGARRWLRGACRHGRGSRTRGATRPRRGGPGIGRCCPTGPRAGGRR